MYSTCIVLLFSMNVLSLQPGILWKLEGQDDIMMIFGRDPTVNFHGYKRHVHFVISTNSVNQTANPVFGAVFFPSIHL